MKKLNNNPKLTAVGLPSTRITNLILNNTKKPMDDPKVRLALDYGTDKEALVNFILFEYGEAAPSYAPKAGMYFNHDLKYRYGLYANTEKYGVIVVPIFGLYYVSSNKKFEADLNLPIIADINYRIRNKLWLGMQFDGLGTTYNLNEQSYSVNGAYVSKTSNELVSYLRFQLSKSVYLNTKIGYAISRNYELYDANDKIDLALTSFYFGDNRTQLNERFKDGAIFKVALFL